MAKIIDLSYEIEEGMATFNASWHPRISVKQLGRIGFEGRETREVCMGTHTGTHIDAPLHFIKHGSSIDQVPLEKLIGPVVIIDFSHLPENSIVTKEMLQSCTISQRMLFKFGWGKHWNDRKFYKDYPFFSPEAAHYLVNHGVEVIGLDTPSPDDSRINMTYDVIGSSHDSPIHKIFLGDGIVLVEYVANLEKVTEYQGWTLIALPIKLKSADGAPARVCLYRE